MGRVTRERTAERTVTTVPPGWVTAVTSVRRARRLQLLGESKEAAVGKSNDDGVAADDEATRRLRQKQRISDRLALEIDQLEFAGPVGGGGAWRGALELGLLR